MGLMNGDFGERGVPPRPKKTPLDTPVKHSPAMHITGQGRNESTSASETGLRDCAELPWCIQHSHRRKYRGQQNVRSTAHRDSYHACPHGTTTPPETEIHMPKTRPHNKKRTKGGYVCTRLTQEGQEGIVPIVCPYTKKMYKSGLRTKGNTGERCRGDHIFQSTAQMPPKQCGSIVKTLVFSKICTSKYHSCSSGRHPTKTTRAAVLVSDQPASAVLSIKFSRQARNQDSTMVTGYYPNKCKRVYARTPSHQNASTQEHSTRAHSKRRIFQQFQPPIQESQVLYDIEAFHITQDRHSHAKVITQKNAIKITS